MAKKASMEKLSALHAALADYFLDSLESGEELSSGTLAAINAFLKNNDVTADPIEGSPMQSIQYKLKEIMQDEKAVA